MRKPFLTLLMLAAAEIPLDCLADTGAEIFLAHGLVAMPDSAFGPDSTVAAVSTRDSVSAPDSVFVPDPATIVLVEFALRDFNEVRVFTDSTRFFSRHVIASLEGVRLMPTNWGHSISESREERLVPWSEVESIKVRKGASGAGLLVGAGLGLAIGMTIALAEALGSAYSLSPSKGSGSAIAWGFLGGAALGWLIDHPGPWRTVYPSIVAPPARGAVSQSGKTERPAR